MGESLAGEIIEFDDRAARRILEALASEVDEFALQSLLFASNRRYELDARPLVERLGSAVARGELVFVQRGLVTVSGTRPEPADEHEHEYVPPVIEEEVLDWIEILIEDQDGRPMREIGYELSLPDGAVRRGRTTREGVIRLDEIPKGECKFALTDSAP
jgi:hypothetical protein